MAWLQILKSELIVTAIVLAVFTPLEMLVPQEKQAFSTRLKGLVFLLCFVPAAIATIMFFRWLWPALGVSFYPLFRIPAGMTWLGPVAAVASPIFAACLYDFFFYWGHRAQHRFFWRFHAVHHSIRELNGINNYHHFTEQFFRLTVFGIPASLVAVDASPALPAAGLLVTLWPYYIHTSTKANLGPLRAIIVDNRFHRIHHSLEPGHHDKNFGAFTTLWDRLFGTAYFPAKDEWPDVGLANIDQPRSVREWITLPWRMGRGAAGARQAIAAE